MRSSSTSSIGAVVAIALTLVGAPPARATVEGPWGRHFHESRPREEWQELRVLVGGGVGIPASFPGGWRPGAGWSFSCLKAVQEWCDVVGDFEDYTHHFDPSDLRAHGATTAGAGSASFGDVAVGVHLHAPFTGPRLYGLVEAALPDVSRPAVSYTDASGSHELRGTEIFGFDPGWVIGAGYELSIPRRIGGLVETRLVFAPGSTRPAEYMISFRACLTAPLPF